MSCRRIFGIARQVREDGVALSLSNDDVVNEGGAAELVDISERTAPAAEHGADAGEYQRFRQRSLRASETALMRRPPTADR